MRNKIEEMDLIYGVSIFNIMDKYFEFKTSNIEEIKSIGNKLNSFYTWLNALPEVNSANIIKLGEILLEDAEIRKLIVESDIDDNFKKLVLSKINKINIIKLNNELLKGTYQYIEYSSRPDRKTKPIDFIKDKLYSSNLLYRDLIMILIENYDFSKSINRMSADNWTIYFINILNMLFFELDNSLLSTREDLYYVMVQLIESRPFKLILYPNTINNYFDYKNKKKGVERCINQTVLNSFHKLNNYYYIEIPEYNYNNTRRHFTFYDYEEDQEFINDIFNSLTLKQKLYIYKLASLDRDYLYTKDDISEIDKFIDTIKNNKHFVIRSQKTDDKIKKLIENNVIFTQEYCKEKNLKVKDFIYNPNYDKSSTKTFLELIINYNNFDYRFALSKYNCSYSWKVLLKNKKNYKINCYLKDDFKHIVQAMFNDSGKDIE